MKTHLTAIVICLLVATAVSVAKSDQSLEQLIARANTAKPERPELYLEVANRELKAALDAYKASRLEQGHAALQEIVSYSDKAHAVVLRSGKRLPQTEIGIRRISARLRDLKLNVEAEQQPPIDAAILKLEGFRTELLKSMFGLKNPAGKK